MNVITNTIAIDVITVFTKCGSFFVLIGTFRGDVEVFTEPLWNKHRPLPSAEAALGPCSTASWVEWKCIVWYLSYAIYFLEIFAYI